MSDNKYTYRYYLLGNTIPVRVVFDSAGLKIGAEIPDNQSQCLVKRTTMLSRLELSDEVDELTQAEFAERCARVYQNKPGQTP